VSSRSGKTNGEGMMRRQSMCLHSYALFVEADRHKASRHTTDTRVCGGVWQHQHRSQQLNSVRRPLLKMHRIGTAGHRHSTATHLLYGQHCCSSARNSPMVLAARPSNMVRV
jgi:hypothetical protein